MFRLAAPERGMAVEPGWFVEGHAWQKLRPDSDWTLGWPGCALQSSRHLRLSTGLAGRSAGVRMLIASAPCAADQRSRIREGTALKIAGNGFALGIRNGTGLTTYSRELAGTLIRAGHTVDAVFRLNGVGRRESLLRARWLQ